MNSSQLRYLTVSCGSMFNSVQIIIVSWGCVLINIYRLLWKHTEAAQLSFIVFTLLLWVSNCTQFICVTDFVWLYAEILYTRVG